MKERILSLISRNNSLVQIDLEEKEIAAIKMLSQCTKIERQELEDFLAEIAIIFAKISNRSYKDMKQIDCDYCMLYSRVFITKEGAYQPNFLLREEFEMTLPNKQVGGNHYQDMPIQPWEFIEKNKIGFSEGNIIKYVARWRKKNGLEDLKKARHYIDLLIQAEEAKERFQGVSEGICRVS